jgi:hypothetical protein
MLYARVRNESDIEANSCLRIFFEPKIGAAVQHDDGSFSLKSHCGLVNILLYDHVRPAAKEHVL